MEDQVRKIPAPDFARAGEVCRALPTVRVSRGLNERGICREEVEPVVNSTATDPRAPNRRARMPAEAI